MTHSIELAGLRRKAIDAGLADVEITSLERELHASGMRIVHILQRVSEQGAIGPLLEHARSHRAYVGLARDTQLDLLVSMERWIERRMRPVPVRVPAPSLPEPDLIGWAEENGLGPLLDRPASDLAAFARGSWQAHTLQRSPSGTIRDAAAGTLALPGMTAPLLAALARAYLARGETALAAARKRREAWASRPEHDVLARIAALLFDRESQLSASEPFEGYIGTLALASSGHTLVARDAIGQTVELSLAAHARGQIEGSPHAKAPTLLALYRAALDIVHDPAHPLHAPLLEGLTTPVWSRMLAEVGRAVASHEELHRTRIVFAVRAEDSGARVEALAQNRAKNGWSRGKRIHQPLAAADPPGRIAMTILSCGYADAPRHALALAALVGHDAVVDADDRAPITVRRAAASLALFEDDAGVVRVGLALDDARVDAASVHALPGEFACYLPERRCVLVASVDAALASALAVARRFRPEGTAVETRESFAAIERIAAHVPIALPESVERDVELVTAPLCVRIEPGAASGGGSERARVTIRVRLGAGLSHPAGEGSSIVSVLAAESAQVVLRRRDLADERERAAVLAQALSLDGFSAELEGDEALLALLDRARAVPDLDIEWPGREPIRLVGAVGSLRVSVRRAADWFGVEGEAEVDGARVTLAALLAAIRAGQRFVRVGPGRFAVIEAQLRERLERAADVIFESSRELAVVPAAGEALEQLASDGMLRADAAWTRIRRRMKSPIPDAPVPRALRAELREYQATGFAWLARLAAIESGAVLADDMGLGKTLQALALLLARAADGPALVVTPTSVSDNWLREAARFAPSLRVRLHRGAGRHALLAREKPGPGEVLVASYDVVALDVESLREIQLATLVLDEAQWIKNPEAQRTVAVRALDARVRVALTGTPLENRLSDLWSITSVVHPGLLGSWEHFRRRFAVPIERDGDRERLRALGELLRPYLLRRTKERVARELPPRIELVREIELSSAERALYDAEREAAIAALADADESKRFQVLASITRLRELACDPALVVPGYDVASSKVLALMDVIEELVAEQHRVLVFSQFVRLLDRVASELDRRAISHLRLDGSTPAVERQRRVERFMGGAAGVFLLSLKAGGAGLNLTAADHVVHLDPWWNPAAEDQASDRAHRIGQDKPVTIVRMVSKDTIESQVLALHEAKRALTRGVLDGAELAATLSASELVALIRGSAPPPVRKRRAGRTSGEPAVE